MNPRVAIALATYNGAAFVEDQVRSLQAQDFADWLLLVRDDGSTDATPALLTALARADPRIRVLESGPRLGAIGNFAEILRQAHEGGAEYVFPCDQDDVWQPAKMSRALARMAELEAQHGRETPLLVHSDLRVVDDGLRPIHASFLRFQGIAHEEATPLQILLVQNFVTGCASLVNRPLLEFALPIPACCIMHDWWLAQCAAAAGRIGFIPDATVLYRQHSTNQIGAGGVWANLNPFHAPGRKHLARSWRTARQAITQAQALHARMVERGHCPPALVALVGDYAGLAAIPSWKRLRTLRRHGIRRHHAYQTAMLMVRIALLGVLEGEEPSP